MRTFRARLVAFVDREWGSLVFAALLWAIPNGYVLYILWVLLWPDFYFSFASSFPEAGYGPRKLLLYLLSYGLVFGLVVSTFAPVSLLLYFRHRRPSRRN